jgi:hypothetical protein
MPSAWSTASSVSAAARAMAASSPVLDGPQVLHRVVDHHDAPPEQLGDHLEARVGHRRLHRQRLEAVGLQVFDDLGIETLSLEPHVPLRPRRGGAGRLDVARVDVEAGVPACHDHGSRARLIEHPVEARQVAHVGRLAHQDGLDGIGAEPLPQRGDARFAAHDAPPARSTAARNPSRYDSTPKPAICPAHAGAITEWRRNDSRAATLERCTSTTGIPIEDTASRSA